MMIGVQVVLSGNGGIEWVTIDNLILGTESGPKVPYLYLRPGWQTQGKYAIKVYNVRRMFCERTPNITCTHMFLCPARLRQVF